MNSKLIRTVLLIGLYCAHAGAASAQEVWVTNSANGDVSVLDGVTLAPLARIPVTSVADPQILIDGDPSAVVFSNDRALAFVALSNGSHVAVIDTATRTVVDYIAIQPVTFDALVSLNPAGTRLYVTSCEDPRVSVIDVATRAVIATINTSSGTYPMAFSQDGQTGYVGNGYVDCGAVNGIHRVNLTTNAVLGFLPTSVPVSDVAVWPLGPYALATGERIVMVDLAATGGEVGAVLCGSTPCSYLYGGGVVFNAAGTRAYATDFHANTLSTIDTDPASPTFQQELSRVAVPASEGQNAWQVAVRDNRAYVAVLGFASQTVAFDISTDTPTPLSVQPVGDYAYELAVLRPSVAGDTGLRNPTANAADSGGDGNGFESSPANAYTDNTSNAVDNNSGTGTSTSCTNSGKDKHRFYNYGFTFPAGATIEGIEVRLDARADSTSNAPRMCVQLSWDGGTTWTSAATTPTLGTSMATFTLGGATDPWGRSWTTGNFTNANFRVRVINVASSTSRDFTLDWVAVRVHYRY
jgi:YVTN family beta-propeller protein